MTERRIYKLSDFFFDLPEELIAQTPPEKREDSRLMVMCRNDGGIEHRGFTTISEYLTPGDVLVLNNARVMPARIFFRRVSGGLVEFILARRLGEDRWLVICNRTKRLKKGEILFADRDPGMSIKVLGRIDDYLEVETSREFTGEILDRIGGIPLPPYIRRGFGPVDRERYQTVYALKNGSAAAPTAGFHFTREMLEKLSEMNVEQVYLTLDVSWGTFQPVRHEDIRLHKMHTERYELPEASAERINRARREGRRIIAVGTTALRVLESTWRGGMNHPGAGETSIFIYPPIEVKSIDGILTNFHTPCSTLLMLVCAFGGYEKIMHAYKTGVAMRYRFFSYGDAMLIL